MNNLIVRGGGGGGGGPLMVNDVTLLTQLKLGQDSV